jgi:predicted Rossmann-fold nucleotide-binding protein
LDESVAEEFVRPEHRDMILVDESPEKLLEKISSYKAPHFEKWIGLKKQESAEL